MSTLVQGYSINHANKRHQVPRVPRGFWIRAGSQAQTFEAWHDRPMPPPAVTVILCACRSSNTGRNFVSIW